MAYMIDRRIGELTVERKHATTRVGIAWLCRCDCGRTAIRTTAALNRAVKEGHVPCCAVCRVELNSGRWLAIHDQARDELRSQWEEFRSLYSPGWEQRIARNVEADLVAEFGEPRDDVPADLTPLAWEPKPTGRSEFYAMTLDEVAKELGITREGVRQIEARAIRKLRHASRAKWLDMWTPPPVDPAALLAASEAQREWYRLGKRGAA
jgi:hypothetical protein